MLDLKFIRQNPELVRAGAQKKRITCDIDRILVLDVEMRSLGGEIDALRQAQKLAGKTVAEASQTDRPRLALEQKDLKTKLKALEERQGVAKAELDGLMLLVPNVPAAEVPDGANDGENVEVERWGEPRRFDFEPRVLTSRSVKRRTGSTSSAARGSRARATTSCEGELALLESAVMRYALDLMVKKGFVPLSVPTLVRPQAMIGTGYFPGGEEQAYRTDERDDLCLVGTAEVPITALHMDEILPVGDLPKLYVAWSPCYRREAGTYGKDTQGPLPRPPVPEGRAGRHRHR